MLSLKSTHLFFYQIGRFRKCQGPWARVQSFLLNTDFGSARVSTRLSAPGWTPVGSLSWGRLALLRWRVMCCHIVFAWVHEW